MPGYAVQDPIYQPAMRLITAITIADQAAITTSFDHDYAVGLIVRLNVPDLYGMYQADQLVGEITEITGSDSFVVDINTTGFDSFSVPTPEPWYQNKFATVTPVGEINNLLTQATRNVS